MHQSSMAAMEGFVATHLAPFRGKPLRILDVGSLDVNGTYRPLFDDPHWHYTGLDLEAGPGADVVIESPYSWRSMKARSFDVVVSGQAFEHIEFPWITILEITRLLVDGGLVCIIVPSGGHEHRYPLDCWRFYPDGAQALARWGDLEVLSVSTAWVPVRDYDDDSAAWADTVLVARKPKWPNIGRRVLSDAKRRVMLRSMSLQAGRRQRT
jgi:hypothetical protein